MGTEIIYYTPNTSILPATPANSVVVLPISAMSKSDENKKSNFNPCIFTDQVGKSFTCNNPHAGIHFLYHYKYNK